MKVDKRKINLSERDLENYIFENPRLIETPFFCRPVTKWIGRQFHVPSGIIDLIGLTEKDEFVIVELKNTEFASSHITQICRYAADIEEAGLHAGILEELHVIKLLIGPYEPSLQIITEGYSVNVYIKTININYDLSIGGDWGYSKSYKEERRKKLIEIANNDEFVRISTISQAKLCASMENN